MMKLFIPKQKIYTADAGLPPTLRTRIQDIYASAVLAPFPPSLTDPRILLSDWSHYQGNVNIGTHLAYGPPKFRGAIFRTGQGKNSSYDDTKFVQNVQMCEANGFPWMIYHVLIPNHDASSQVGRLYNILNKVQKLPRWAWWDVQVHNGYSKRHISNLNIQAIELTKTEIMPETGNYSAQWFTNGYMETQDWFSEIVWWIAQWYAASVGKEHPWPTALPATVDISQVMMHQTTSWGDGKLCGVGSTRLDLDRWMWTEQKFNEIMGTTPQPPPNGDVWKQIELLWVAIEELKNGTSSDRAQLEQLTQWAKQISYIEAA